MLHTISKMYWKHLLTGISIWWHIILVPQHFPDLKYKLQVSPWSKFVTLPEVAKHFVETKTSSANIYSTTKVSISGSEFSRGMFVSAAQTGGLPNFSRIDHILLLNNTVYFHCRDYISWYTKHLCSFWLTSRDTFSVYHLSELNDMVCLPAYNIDGHLVLTQKKIYFDQMKKEFKCFRNII